ncbi:hypothetical protein TNCV_2684701 [Trichonephila clavipes]|nr:hypothetical protein TNCV_2684701 [Trichonephila clavipes]
MEFMTVYDNKEVDNNELSTESTELVDNFKEKKSMGVRMASSSSVSGRCEVIHAKLLGGAHRSLFERQTLNQRF